MSEASEKSAAQIESESLSIGKWGNLFMAFAGILAAWASRSDALLVDGLYSGVNFLAAIVASRVGLSIARQADQKRPFGYDADEAIYVTFRSMALIGILAFAMFNAISKIITYAMGGSVPALNFGPILVYVVLMVSICAALAILHHWSYVKTGRRSEVLVTERRAAIVDGVLSAGAGIALLLVPFLKGTSFEVIIPIADALVVLTLCALIINQPISAFRSALGEISGESASAEKINSVRQALTRSVAGLDIKVVDLAIMKLGRRYTVVGYLDPDRLVVAADVDRFNDGFYEQCAKILGDVRTEIILTEKPRHAVQH